jgi:hypothetical protein
MRLERMLPKQHLHLRRRALWALETWQAGRSVAKRYKLPPWQPFLEQAALFREFGLDQYAYYRYRLYEPTLAHQDKGRYLPDSVAWNSRVWALLTPPRYRSLYDNKLIFNRFFGALGLPLARILAVYDPREKSSGAINVATTEQLSARLSELGGTGFVVKPVEGIQGHKILVFRGPAPGEDGVFQTLAGDRYDAAGIIAYLTTGAAHLLAENPGADPYTFLVEERLLPHPELAAFIGPTLCTVRVQTLIGRDGLPRILAAVFKLQPGKSGVDHLIYGAVGCWVDRDTGKLGRGRSRLHDEDVTTVPETDRSFLGFQLPLWEETRAVALEAAAAFPWARCIGWDIGLSDRGPVIVEGNERWSPSLIQMPAPEGLFTGELKAVVDELSGVDPRIHPA